MLGEQVLNMSSPESKEDCSPNVKGALNLLKKSNKSALQIGFQDAALENSQNASNYESVLGQIIENP